MFKQTSLLVLVLLLTASLATPVHGQKKKRKKKQAETEQKASKPSTSKKKPKSIKEFIKKHATKDEGLFTVYLQDGKMYFEVADSCLNQDMLLISRIAKIPSNLSPYLNAGSKVGEQSVVWQKKEDKILLRTQSYQNVADEADPILLSVESNNFQPIIKSFKIEAYNQDSTSYLIDVSSIYNSEIKALSGLNSRVKSSYKIKGFDKSRSMLEEVKSFPINIEIKHITTYNASSPPTNRKTESISLLMNQSLILLPKEKMQKRYSDERVGWFSIRQIDYSSDALKSDSKRYIRRWNLIPKDIEAYKRGELVEPVKPIVYYLDPATPKKWRPYFKQGIEDWNACFETAGFKNAIIAKDPPTKEEDPEFSPEDARYSVVRYVASTTRNAMGPSVSDPRTGEIIESDIIWYHNHLRSYRNRYLLETGAANPKARSLDTPEEEIGEMMRRVISHEIGHALGLPHNMKASAAYPVDSLRNGAFTQKYGIATTIMDYARYNYVAQPGDENIRFVRQLGPYDHYSINWGYRYIPDADTEEEKATLKKWITEKGDNPMYLFGAGYPRFDPNSLTENIGNDNVKASEYGIKNLKIVANNLVDWTTEDGENYDELEELYGEFIGVWSRYIGHVIPLIGGVNETLKTSDQDGVVYQHVDKNKQKEAIRFLLREAFQEQSWLTPKSIQSLISYESSLEKITARQAGFLNALLNEDRLKRVIENEFLNDTDALSLSELLAELTNGIIKTGKSNHVQRILQRNYVQRLGSFFKESDDKRRAPYLSDIRAIMRYQLLDIKKYAQSKSNTGAMMDQAHFQDLEAQIDQILEIE